MHAHYFTDLCTPKWLRYVNHVYFIFADLHCTEIKNQASKFDDAHIVELRYNRCNVFKERMRV